MNLSPTAQRRMNIVALCARKGGCGKTTSAASLAVCAYLRARHLAEPEAPPPRIAVIDLDPQGCLTELCGNLGDDGLRRAAYRGG